MIKILALLVFGVAAVYAHYYDESHFGSGGRGGRRVGYSTRSYGLSVGSGGGSNYGGEGDYGYGDETTIWSHGGGGNYGYQREGNYRGDDHISVVSHGGGQNYGYEGVGEEYGRLFSSLSIAHGSGGNYGGIYGHGYHRRRRCRCAHKCRRYEKRFGKCYGCKRWWCRVRCCRRYHKW